MKIRYGFVTNSSSSSFIIATKKELNKNNAYDFFLEQLNLILKPNHPIFVDFVERFASHLFDQLKQDKFKSYNPEKYYEYNYGETDQIEMNKFLARMRDFNFIYEGSFGSEDFDGISEYFYSYGEELKFDISNDELKIDRGF